MPRLQQIHTTQFNLTFRAFRAFRGKQIPKIQHPHSHLTMRKYIPLCLLTFSLAHAEPSLVVSESALANLIHSQNPELKAARWKIQEAVGKWQQAGRHSRPKLDIELEHDAAFTERELRVGLSRSLPLTNRLSLEKEISKAKLDAAEWEIQQAERVLLRDARILFTKALALKGRKLSLIAEEKEALDLAQQAYQQSQGDLTEIFRARAQKRQLTRASIDALSSCHRARIRYEAALPKN
jgi:outer membrane protein, heavy metal efflux system